MNPKFTLTDVQPCDVSETPLPPPRTALWELTTRCNLRCLHCAVRAGAPRGGELTTEEALDVCGQFAELGVPSVCLMGGEPFLRDDWDVIAAKLRGLGIAVGVVTNGLDFDETRAGRLTRLGVSQVGVSLDAADAPTHDGLRGMCGAHAAAVEAIHRLHAMEVPCKTVITSVNKRNLDQLECLSNWLVTHARGFTWMINVTSCRPETRLSAADTLDEEEFVRLARFINEHRPRHRPRLNITGSHDIGYMAPEFPHLYDFEWRGCQAGIDVLGIQSDGSVKGCLMLGDEFIEGTVRSRRLNDLWNDPRAFGLSRRFHTDLLEGACRGCAHGAVCRGGCRDIAHTVTGSPYHYPFCLSRRHTTGDTASKMRSA